jgi:hypothetical protein
MLAHPHKTTGVTQFIVHSFLACAWLSLCSFTFLTPKSMANSGAAMNTGIEAFESQHCWYDDTHVIISQRTRLPGRDQTEGLFLLDVTKPRELTRLDLAPLSPDIQRELTGLSCQDQSIVFYRYLPGRQIRETYTMALGTAPERLSELRGDAVSLRGRYLLGNSAKVIRDGGPFQGTFEGNDDCDVRYVRPGFRVLCWDSFQYVNWPLTTFVLSEYRWQESIKVHADQGTKIIPNPRVPLMGKDGKPGPHALHLRDLTGHIVATLTDDPRYAPWLDNGFPVTPDQSFVYATCSERAKPIGLAHIVCRYRLDGQQHNWEEVFRSDLVKQIQSSIVKLSVSNPGDVYFDFPTKTHDPNGGIWRFDAKLKAIAHVVADTSTHRYSEPSVSPNGEWLLYVRKGKEGAKFMLLPIGNS